MSISKLPTKGKLYQTSDGTLNGNRTLVEKVYNNFDVGDVISQYLDSVTAVSSFWGGPPYAGYHPLTIIGAPDCRTYGECVNDDAWVSDMSSYPEVGQRLLHESLVAFVTGVDSAAGTLSIEYHAMYKSGSSGALVQCIIDPSGASKTYPADCNLDLSGFDINPATNRLRAT
eukprot:7081751-Prymnesium_polylepis.1